MPWRRAGASSLRELLCLAGLRERTEAIGDQGCGGEGKLDSRLGKLAALFGAHKRLRDMADLYEGHTWVLIILRGAPDLRIQKHPHLEGRYGLSPIALFLSLYHQHHQPNNNSSSRRDGC